MAKKEPRKQKTAEDVAEPKAKKEKKAKAAKPGPLPAEEKFQPKSGQSFTAEDVLAVERDLEDQDLTPKYRQELERKRDIMLQRIPVEEYKAPTAYILNLPFAALARFHYVGWKLTAEQLVELVEAGAPAAKIIWPGLVTTKAGVVATFLAKLAEVVDHKIEGFVKSAQEGGDNVQAAS